jgi:LacI family transcriptional regulator
VAGHRVRDIAEQSGLSEATVDRVLHRRAGVSPRAVRAVEQAVLELDRQQTQLRLGARTLLLDVVMQAPARFSTAVRDALEAELPAARPATVRARFHLRESGTATDIAQALDSLGRRGRSCEGVL